MNEATTDSVAEKIADAAHEANEKAAAGVINAKRRIKDTASDVSETLKETALGARHVSEDAFETVSDYVREHPLITIGAAFAAGVVIYSMLRR